MMRRKQREAMRAAALFAEQEAHRQQVCADFETARETYINGGGSVEDWDAAFVDWVWIQPMTPFRLMILVIARTYAIAALERQKKVIADLGGAE